MIQTTDTPITPKRLSTAAGVSIALIALQAVLQVTDLIPATDATRKVALAAHVIYETLSKLRAFLNNPDGTDARLPWDGGTY